MATISSLSASLFTARPSQASSALFAAARAESAAAGSTTTRTQQNQAKQVLEARQIAVTKGLQSLERALSAVEFDTTDRAGDREEIREDRLRTTQRDVYRTETIIAREDILATRDLTEAREIRADRNIFRSRPVFETRDVVETHDILETRDVTETRDVFETRDVLETRDVFETQDVTETRDITETRPVYTQQDIHETIVDGSRTLTSFNRINNAGIDTGADFSVTVGTEATATIRFVNATRISLTVSGQTTNFNFTSNNGSWRTALVSALDSVSNLEASIGADGHLRLETANAEDLRIADVANGVFDFSASPLSSLGLTAGTTTSTVTGQQQVQTGTEDVVIGTEQVVVGTEQVLVGTEQVVVGTEEVLVGTENVVIGTEQVVVGTEDVVVGTEQVETGTESFIAGTVSDVIGHEAVLIGTQTFVASGRDVVTGTRQVLDRSETVDTGILENVLIGFSLVGPGATPEAATTKSRRSVLENALALDTAIGKDRADNPFASLRDSLGLDSLVGSFTREQRDAALTKVQAALNAFRKSTAATSPATLLQAGIALGQGTTGSAQAYSAPKATASTLGIRA